MSWEIGDDAYFVAGPYQEIGSDDVSSILAGYGDRWRAGATTIVPATAPTGSPAMSPGFADTRANKLAIRNAMAQRLVDQGTIVQDRAPTRSRIYVLGFDSVSTVAAAATSVLEVQPQVLFRPERLVVAAAIADDFLINDFKVGKNSQLATTGSIPGSMFSPDAFGIRLKCDTAQPSMLLSLSVTNISAGALRFNAGLVGEAVE